MQIRCSTVDRRYRYSHKERTTIGAGSCRVWASCLSYPEIQDPGSRKEQFLPCRDLKLSVARSFHRYLTSQHNMDATDPFSPESTAKWAAEDKGPKVLTVVSITTAVATVFVLARLAVRRRMQSRFRLDDWFIIASIVRSTPKHTARQKLADFLADMRMDGLGLRTRGSEVRLWETFCNDLPSQPTRRRTMECHCLLTENLLLLSAKICRCRSSHTATKPESETSAISMVDEWVLCTGTPGSDCSHALSMSTVENAMGSFSRRLLHF